MTESKTLPGWFLSKVVNKRGIYINSYRKWRGQHNTLLVDKRREWTLRQQTAGSTLFRQNRLKHTLQSTKLCLPGIQKKRGSVSTRTIAEPIRKHRKHKI